MNPWNASIAVGFGLITTIVVWDRFLRPKAWFIQEFISHRGGRRGWGSRFSFPHGRHRVHAKCSSGFGRTTIEIRIRSPFGQPASLRLATERHPNRAGLQDRLELPIRGTYRVFVSSLDEANRTLGERGRWDVYEWITTPGCNACFLDASEGQLVLASDIQFVSSHQLNGWIDRSLALFDQMETSLGNEIQFLDPSLEDNTFARSKTQVQPAVCSICVQPLLDRWVVCSRCQTPHHRDCWEFNGRCSTFGCSSSDCEECTQSLE